MQNERFIVAIELGSSKARIGVAGYDPEDKTNRLTVYHTASLPTVDSVRYGRIQNPREVTGIVSELLNEVQKKYPIEGRNILGAYVGMGGRSLKSHKINAEILLPERREITEEMLERLENEAINRLSTQDQLITIEPARFMVDNMVTPRPIGSLGSRLSGEYTVVTCNPANKNDIVEVISNRVGLNIRGLSVQPLALAHLVLSPQETKAGCMLVDFGAETITVSIFKDYALQYLATIPIGSRLITLDLAKVLALTEDEAEKIKLAQGNAMPEKSGETGGSPDDENINAIITARIADIVANINAQPEFAGIPQLSLPAGIILTGGGAKMHNFARLLESVMHLKVRIATLPPEIIITDTEISATDNIDLIALLSEGAESAKANGDPECVTAPPAKNVAQPVVEKKEEPEVVFDFKNKTEQPVETDFDPYFGFENPDDGFSEAPAQKPTKNTGTHTRFENDDDPDLLADSDDEKPKVRKDIQKGGSKKAAKNKESKESDEGEEKQSPLSNKFDFYIRKFRRILSTDGDDDSADM